MAAKYHPTPLSGGDRKALTKELGKARLGHAVGRSRCQPEWLRTFCGPSSQATLTSPFPFRVSSASIF